MKKQMVWAGILAVSLFGGAIMGRSMMMQTRNDVHRRAPQITGIVGSGIRLAGGIVGSGRAPNQA